MGLQGGDDRFSYRPYDPHDEESGTIGHHRGSSESLNISGAIPGYHYCYKRNDSNSVVRAMGQGYEIVAATDPERFGTRRLPDGVQSQIDGMRTYQDVVLMRIPIEDYDKLQAEKSVERSSQLTGITDTYFAEGENRARALGSGAPEGRPIYYARMGHGVTHEDV